MLRSYTNVSIVVTTLQSLVNAGTSNKFLNKIHLNLQSMANNSNPMDMGGENSMSKETRGRGRGSACVFFNNTTPIGMVMR